MRTILILSIVFATALSAQQPAQRPVLEARFIGNMAYAISDGETTLFSDFPYESGYSVYMEYDANEIRSGTPKALTLITHRHGDHWDAPLFNKTDWQVIAPADALTAVAPARVVRALPVAPARATIVHDDISVEAMPTPHAKLGHYSYIVTWHGRRLFFSGDTEDPAELLAAKNLDVAFVSPWLFESAGKRGRIDARRIVIYHQTAGTRGVAGCAGLCSVPNQGETLTLR